MNTVYIISLIYLISFCSPSVCSSLDEHTNEEYLEQNTHRVQFTDEEGLGKSGGSGDNNDPENDFIQTPSTIQMNQGPDTDVGTIDFTGTNAERSGHTGFIRNKRKAQKDKPKGKKDKQNEKSKTQDPKNQGGLSITPDDTIVKAKTTGVNSVWLIGGNGTIMKCDWYAESDSMPLVSDEDRDKLAKLEMENQKANERISKKVIDNFGKIIPFKYLVCDAKVTDTGIVVDVLGYPFLALSISEFQKAYMSAQYIPFPCEDDMGFFKKLERWTSRLNILVGSAFIGKLNNQMFFNSNMDITIIVSTILFTIGLCVWLAFLIKKILEKKSQHNIFLPSIKNVLKYQTDDPLPDHIPPRPQSYVSRTNKEIDLGSFLLSTRHSTSKNFRDNRGVDDIYQDVDY